MFNKRLNKVNKQAESILKSSGRGACVAAEEIQERGGKNWEGHHQRDQVNVLPFFALKTLWMASCENEALSPCHAAYCLASWIPGGFQCLSQQLSFHSWTRGCSFFLGAPFPSLLFVTVGPMHPQGFSSVETFPGSHCVLSAHFVSFGSTCLFV